MYVLNLLIVYWNIAETEFMNAGKIVTVRMTKTNAVLMDAATNVSSQSDQLVPASRWIWVS